MTRDRRHQRGATIVEAALTMLLFLTLIMAVLEFGRILNIYHTITDAAREGARFSVAPYPGVAGVLPSSGDVQTQVCTFLTSASLPCTGITINQNYIQTVDGVATSFTKVDVSAPYTFLFVPFGTSITLNTHAVMRNETN
jgi:Flp pilus assembly protein TadG